MKAPLPMAAENLLPHAAPMCCITRLLECSGTSATAEAVIHPEHILLTDGKLERAGIVEIAAQTAAAMDGYNNLLLGRVPGIGYLVGVQDFTFHEDIAANTILHATVTCAGGFNGIEVLSAEVFCEKTLVAQGKLKIYLPESSPESRQAGEHNAG